MMSSMNFHQRLLISVLGRSAIVWSAVRTSVAEQLVGLRIVPDRVVGNAGVAQRLAEARARSRHGVSCIRRSCRDAPSCEAMRSDMVVSLVERVLVLALGLHHFERRDGWTLSRCACIAASAAAACAPRALRRSPGVRPASAPAHWGLGGDPPATPCRAHRASARW